MKYIKDNNIVLLPYEITLFSNNANCIIKFLVVLLPYEITLFSNSGCSLYFFFDVLLPYEITLFSNCIIICYTTCIVLLPYEITLFSNLKSGSKICISSNFEMCRGFEDDKIKMLIWLRLKVS